MTVHRPNEISLPESYLTEDDPWLFRHTLCARNSDNAAGAREQIPLRDASLEARDQFICAYPLPECESNGAANEVHTCAQRNLVGAKVSATEPGRQLNDEWLAVMEDNVSLHDSIANAHTGSSLLNQVADRLLFFCRQLRGKIAPVLNNVGGEPVQKLVIAIGQTRGVSDAFQDDGFSADLWTGEKFFHHYAAGWRLAGGKLVSPIQVYRLGQPEDTTCTSAVHGFDHQGETSAKNDLVQPRGGFDEAEPGHRNGVSAELQLHVE